MTRFTITHTPSGDVAEADDLHGAEVAARTLLADYDLQGTAVVTAPGYEASWGYSLEGRLLTVMGAR